MTRAFQFNPGFQLGVATAAAQIEGGKVDSTGFIFGNTGSYFRWLTCQARQPTLGAL